MKLPRMLFFCVLCLAGALLISESSSATTYNWNYIGGGAWSTSANWNPVGVPGLNDQATISPNVNATITAGTANINTLKVGSDAQGYSDQITLQAGTLNFYQGSSLAPTLYNYGTIQVTSGIYNQYTTNGSTGHFTFTSSAAHPGTITLMGPNTYLDATSYLPPDRTIVNGAYHTIQGAGTVLAQPLYNYGTIQATRGTLTLASRNDWTLYNYGTLGAAAKADPGDPDNILIVNYQVRAMSANNQINPTGGLVKVWNLYGDQYPVNLGAGQVNVSRGPSSADPYLYGKINLAPGTVLNLDNTSGWINFDKAGTTSSVITNNGTINLTSDPNNPYYYLNTNTGTTFTGSGRLVLDGNSSTTLYSTHVYYPTDINYYYTNDVNHTIEGGGSLGAINYATDKIMTNNGKIIANHNTLLIAERIDGTGSVKADGGKLDIQANLTTKDLTLTNKAGTALNVSKPAYYAAPIVEVTGNFLYSLNDPTKWNWGTGTTLKMSGQGPDWHFLEVGGSGFSLRTLNIAGNIALVDIYDNTPGPGIETLYVDSLIFSGSTLDLNGLSLYVGGNLVHAGDYGGKIIDTPVQPPAVPVPHSVLLLGSGLLGLGGWRRFRKS
jgi:hypothetical protein